MWGWVLTAGYMKHIDLFSGIGGFAYAAREVWGDDHKVVTFCEINKYAQQVLKKHWPNVPICEDIRKLNYAFIANSSNTGIKNLCGRKDEILQVDLLTGGFPCQPFSNAGKKRGKDDDRFLWPEMLRVIKEFKPSWIVGENVAGLIGMAQQQGDAEVGGETNLESGDYDQSEAGGLLYGIIDDIEQAGYTVQAFVIPACAVNAPHRRDRIWIVANSTSDRCELRRRDREERHIQDTSKREVEEDKPERSGRFNRSCTSNNVASHSGRELREQRNGEGMEACTSERSTGTAHSERCGEDASYSIGERLERRSNKRPGLSGQCHRDGSYQRGSWDQNWIEVATKFCGMDDGLPVELDEFKLSKSQHRVERLKALGNAIVPSVVMEIFKAIKEVDNETIQRKKV